MAGYGYAKSVIIPDISTNVCHVQTITPDGVLAPDEWPVPAVPIKEAPDRTTISGKPGELRVVWDDANLYVAVSVPVADADRLVLDDVWGTSDGAEVCVRNAVEDPPGPTYVLRGFPTGRLDISPDAGAVTEDVYRMIQGARFGAKIGEGRWKSTEDPGYKEMYKLVKNAIKPLPYKDIAGTCGRDEGCLCRGCWIRKRKSTQLGSHASRSR